VSTISGEVQQVAMEELRKTIISASVSSVEIKALRSMVDYDLKIIDDFDVKNTILKLIQNQELIQSKIREICEEQKHLMKVMSKSENSGN
jgi:hypothetical protein